MTTPATRKPSVRLRPGAGSAVVLAIPVVICANAATAQVIDTYFPQGLTGFDQQPGVTVLTRQRPLYDPIGIHAGDFLVQPRLDQSVFYNSNVTVSGGSGSWGSHTSGGVSAASGWTRDSLSTVIGVDHYQFLSLPGDSYTDWTIGLGGGYTIGDSDLAVAYAHQSSHQLGTTIGTVRSQTPVPGQTDTARIAYTVNIGRLSITPDLSASAYRFGAATVAGVVFSQDYLNRDVIAGGVTARYSLSEEGGVLVVVRGLRSSYPSPAADQPDKDYTSFQVLGGIDYQAKGPWRYRLLAGVEVRDFSAARYGTSTAPDVEASVSWTPTGLTTVTGTVANAIEAPQTAGTSGYVLSQARLVIDHEYRSDIVVQAHGGAQYARYFQNGGTQTRLNGGAGITWLINRGVRLSLDYDYTSQSASGITPGQSRADLSALQYDQTVVALTLHLAL